MGIQLNKDGVLSLACAVFLAGAIGLGAMSGSTNGCAAPRLDRGESGADNRQSCDVAEPGDLGPDRPGMRFMKN